MEPLKKLEFRKIDGTVIVDVEKYVKDWTKENPKGRVIIGCDSQMHSRRIKYSIIICMHIIDAMNIGRGCHLLIADVWEKSTCKNKIDEMPSKLWKEALYALSAANMVNGNDETFKQHIEVHLDFNSDKNKKSNMMHDAGIGMIGAAGYVTFGKPFAKIASNVADHFCR